jgi:flagellar biosynthesis protein FlhF
MRLKSYFAGTVEAAMSLAARELGDDAMLVYSREADPETQYLGRYEVVFGLDGPSSSGAPPPALAPKAPYPAAPYSNTPPREPDSGLEQLSRAVQDICSQLESLSARLRTPAAPSHNSLLDPLFQSPVWGRWARRLTEQGVPARRLPDLLPAGDRQAVPKSPLAARDEIARRISSALKFRSLLGAASGGKRVIALAGPAAAGKTTCLLKMAAAYILSSGRLPQFIALHPAGSSPSAKLSHYAGILGVPLASVSSPSELPEAVRGAAGASLVLLDTPGFGPRDEKAIQELGAVLAGLDEIETHLVLQGCWDQAVLDRFAARYEPLCPSCLQFTYLDETLKFGPLWAHAAQSGKALSYFSSGPSIPGDFEPASAAFLSARLVGPAPAAAQAPPPSPESLPQSRWQAWAPPAALATEPVIPLAPPAADPPRWFTGTFEIPAWPAAAGAKTA